MLDRVAKNMIARAITTAKILQDQVKPVLDSVNVLYDSAGGYKETITQADLDEIESLAGITKQQLDDSLFLLTGVVRVDLANSYAALAVLAAR